MILTLEVVSPRPDSLGTASSQSFGSEGGTIGRARSSDWVLPHSKVSNRHAVITCVNGAFFIEDTSTNGVYVNQARERLVRGRPQQLKPGDRIVIDPYDIRVAVAGAARAGGSAADPFGSDDPFESSLLGHRGPSAQSSRDADVLGEVDPLKLLEGEAPKARPRKVPTARALDADSPLAEHYRPPAVPPSPPEIRRRLSVPLIPEDYDPLASDSGAFRPPLQPPIEPAAQVAVPDPFGTENRGAGIVLAGPQLLAAASLSPVVSGVGATPIPDLPAPPNAVRPAAAAPVSDRLPTPAAPLAPLSPRLGASAHEGLAAMLAGAGLEDVEISEDLARDFGRILRVVVEGVMDVLRARQQIKDEFRMRMTQFRPADNNPLKFSANVDDALHNLLVKRNAAYLPAVDAFEDAFDDVRAHQIAMLSGMRVAFEAMLAHFDPAQLQAQFDRQLKKGSLLTVPAKLRYWDLYREKSDALLADPEASFRKLFGESFARAYEEQLARLKAESPAAPKAGLPD